MNLEKWMYKNHIYPRIYNRHPDTGDKGFMSAYIGTYNHTEQVLIKKFIENGWKYLRTENNYRLVFVKVKE